MNKLKLIVAALFASAFLIAYAQSPYTNTSTTRTTKTQSNHSVEIERHIKDLQAKLKITPAEESQWEIVAQTMRDNASEMDSAIEKHQASVNSGTAIDNLNSYADVVQAHADAIKKLATAFSTLYDSMPMEQKKVADDLFAQRVGTKVAKK